MTETFETRVNVQKTGTSNTTVVLDANSGNMTLGNHSTDGDVLLKDNSGVTRIHLDAGNHTIKINDADGNLIAELGRNGNLRIGGGTRDGDLEAFNAAGQRTAHLDGGGGNFWLGGNGTDGDIVLFPNGVANTNSTADATIHLDGDAGDIILRNADAAEDFDVRTSDADAGSVLVIDHDGKLDVATTAYDRRVAGVVSGAGEYAPGLILDRQPGREDRAPVALAGKVVVKADATTASIEVGDLLTTSSTPGHAMKAADPSQAFGAVIGKALAPLTDGIGSVPILVSLQ